MVPSSYAVQEYVANSPLGKSGCLAAFALIFLSELGDKTFFIAALLAMKVGKLLSFAGSVAALSFMTFISVGIGMVFSKVPDQFHSTAPIGQYAGIALLIYFGVKTLKVGACWCSTWQPHHLQNCCHSCVMANVLPMQQQITSMQCIFAVSMS